MNTIDKQLLQENLQKYPDADYDTVFLQTLKQQRKKNVGEIAFEVFGEDASPGFVGMTVEKTRQSLVESKDFAKTLGLNFAKIFADDAGDLELTKRIKSVEETAQARATERLAANPALQALALEEQTHGWGSGTGSVTRKIARSFAGVMPTILTELGMYALTAGIGNIAAKGITAAKVAKRIDKGLDAAKAARRLRKMRVAKYTSKAAPASIGIMSLMEGSEIASQTSKGYIKDVINTIGKEGWKQLSEEQKLSYYDQAQRRGALAGGLGGIAVAMVEHLQVKNILGTAKTKKMLADDMVNRIVKDISSSKIKRVTKAGLNTYMTNLAEEYVQMGMSKYITSMAEQLDFNWQETNTRFADKMEEAVKSGEVVDAAVGTALFGLGTVATQTVAGRKNTAKYIQQSGFIDKKVAEGEITPEQAKEAKAEILNIHAIEMAGKDMSKQEAKQALRETEKKVKENPEIHKRIDKIYAKDNEKSEKAFQEQKKRDETRTYQFEDDGSVKVLELGEVAREYESYEDFANKEKTVKNESIKNYLTNVWSRKVTWKTTSGKEKTGEVISVTKGKTVIRDESGNTTTVEPDKLTVVDQKSSRATEDESDKQARDELQSYAMDENIFNDLPDKDPNEALNQFFHGLPEDVRNKVKKKQVNRKSLLQYLYMAANDENVDYSFPANKILDNQVAAIKWAEQVFSEPDPTKRGLVDATLLAQYEAENTTDNMLSSEDEQALSWVNSLIGREQNDQNFIQDKRFQRVLQLEKEGLLEKQTKSSGVYGNRYEYKPISKSDQDFDVNIKQELSKITFNTLEESNLEELESFVNGKDKGKGNQYKALYDKLNQAGKQDKAEEYRTGIKGIVDNAIGAKKEAVESDIKTMLNSRGKRVLDKSFEKLAESDNTEDLQDARDLVMTSLTKLEDRVKEGKIEKGSRKYNWIENSLKSKLSTIDNQISNLKKDKSDVLNESDEVVEATTNDMNNNSWHKSFIPAIGFIGTKNKEPYKSKSTAENAIKTRKDIDTGYAVAVKGKDGWYINLKPTPQNVESNEANNKKPTDGVKQDTDNSESPFKNDIEIGNSVVSSTDTWQIKPDAKLDYENLSKSEVRVIKALKSGKPLTINQIMKQSKLSKRGVLSALKSLNKQGALAGIGDKDVKMYKEYLEKAEDVRKVFNKTSEKLSENFTTISKSALKSQFKKWGKFWSLKKKSLKYLLIDGKPYEWKYDRQKYQIVQPGSATNTTLSAISHREKYDISVDDIINGRISGKIKVDKDGMVADRIKFGLDKNNPALIKAAKKYYPRLYELYDFIKKADTTQIEEKIYSFEDMRFRVLQGLSDDIANIQTIYPDGRKVTGPNTPHIKKFYKTLDINTLKKIQNHPSFSHNEALRQIIDTHVNEKTNKSKNQKFYSIDGNTPTVIYRGYALSEDRKANNLEETIGNTAVDYNDNFKGALYFTDSEEEAGIYAKGRADKSKETFIRDGQVIEQQNRHYTGDFAKVSGYYISKNAKVEIYDDILDYNKNHKDTNPDVVILKAGTLNPNNTEFVVLNKDVVTPVSKQNNTLQERNTYTQEQELSSLSDKNLRQQYQNGNISKQDYLTEFRRRRTSYQKIDKKSFSKYQKSFILTADSESVKANKKLAKKITKRLKKHFPFIKAEVVEDFLGITTEDGSPAYGKAFGNTVQWLKDGAKLDTPPHEYAHIYIKLFKDHPVIKKALTKFNGNEEALAQAMGELYVKKAKQGWLKTAAKQLWTLVKKFFRVSQDSDILQDLVNNYFYQGRLLNENKVNTNQTIEYQIDRIENMLDEDAIDDNVSTNTAEIKMNEFSDEDIYVNAFNEPISSKDFEMLSFLANDNSSTEDFINDVEFIFETDETQNKDGEVFTDRQKRYLKVLRLRLREENVNRKHRASRKENDRFYFAMVDSGKKGLQITPLLPTKSKNESDFVHQDFVDEDGNVIDPETQKSYNDTEASTPLERLARKFGKDFRFVFLNDSDIYKRINYKDKNTGRWRVKYQQQKQSLSGEDIKKLTPQFIENGLVPLFTRGEQSKWIFLPLKRSDVKHLSKYSGDKQVKIWKALADEYRKEVLDFFIPNHETLSIDKIFKRIKIPLTPSLQPHIKDLEDIGLNTMRMLYYDPEETIIEYDIGEKKKPEQFEMAMPADVSGVKDNLNNGATFLSQSVMKNLSDLVGAYKGNSFLKTVYYDSDGKNMIAGKHLETIGVDGISFKSKKTGKVFARMKTVPHEVKQVVDGEEVKKTIYNVEIIAPDENGNWRVIDGLTSSDEIKLSTGKYDVNHGQEFNMPGAARHYIQVPTEKHKTDVKFPIQAFNYIQDNTVIEAMTEYLLKSQAVKNVAQIKKIFKDGASANAFLKFFNKHPRADMAEVLKWTQNNMGRHKVLEIPFTRTLERKILRPALEQSIDGSQMYLAPNLNRKVKRDEALISYKNKYARKVLRERFKKANPDHEGNISLKEMNAWLAENPQKLFAVRFPVVNEIGYNVYTVKEVHNVGSGMMLHPFEIFGRLQADHDGDKVQTFFVDDNETGRKLLNAIEKRKQSDDYKAKEKKVVNLDAVQDILQDEFGSKETGGKKTDDFLEFAVRQTAGSESIPEIASVQSIVGMLERRGFSFKIKNSKDEVLMAMNPLKTTASLESVKDILNAQERHLYDKKVIETVEDYLALYLQAAVDNGKYTVLSDMGYDIDHIKEVVLGIETAFDAPEQHRGMIQKTSVFRLPHSIKKGRVYGEILDFNSTIAYLYEFKDHLENPETLAQSIVKNITIADELSDEQKEDQTMFLENHKIVVEQKGEPYILDTVMMETLNHINQLADILPKNENGKKMLIPDATVSHILHQKIIKKKTGSFYKLESKITKAIEKYYRENNLDDTYGQDAQTAQQYAWETMQEWDELNKKNDVRDLYSLNPNFREFIKKREKAFSELTEPQKILSTFFLLVDSKKIKPNGNLYGSDFFNSEFAVKHKNRKGEIVPRFMIPPVETMHNNTNLSENAITVDGESLLSHYGKAFNQALMEYSAQEVSDGTQVNQNTQQQFKEC